MARAAWTSTKVVCVIEKGLEFDTVCIYRIFYLVLAIIITEKAHAGFQANSSNTCRAGMLSIQTS